MPQSIYDEYFENSATSIEDSLAGANKAMLDKEALTQKYIIDILDRVKHIESSLIKSTSTSKPKSESVRSIKSTIDKIYDEVDSNPSDTSTLNKLVNSLSNQLAESGHKQESAQLSRSQFKRSNIQSREGSDKSTTSKLLKGTHPVLGLMSDLLPSKSSNESTSNVVPLMNNSEASVTYDRESARDITELDKHEQKRHDDLIRYLRKVLDDKGTSTDNTSILGSAVSKVGSMIASGAGGVLSGIIGASVAAISSPAILTGLVTAVVAGVAYLYRDKIKQGMSDASEYLDNSMQSISEYSINKSKSLKDTLFGKDRNPEYLMKEGKLTSDGTLGPVIDAAARFESDNNPNPEADKYKDRKRDTTSGLLQFTDSTYNEIASTYYDEFTKRGLNPEDKNNEENQRLAGELHFKRNRSYFEKVMGRSPTDTELASTNLGVGHITKLLKASPSDSINKVFSEDIIKKNPSLMNQGDTVQSVRDKISSAYNVPSSDSQLTHDTQDPKLTVRGADSPDSSMDKVNPDLLKDVLREYKKQDASSSSKNAGGMSFSSGESMGRNVSSVPFFINDTGMLLVLSGMA